jgi:hypothetical protein
MADHDGAVRGGHISFEQAEGIIGRTGRAPVVGSRAAEVLGYLGAVALAVATLVLAYDIGFGAGGVTELVTGLFDNIPAGMVTLVGAAILLVLGTRFAENDAGAIRRSGGFTLLTGFVLSAFAFGLLLYDLDLGDATPLVRLIPVAVVAIYVWQRSPSVPTQIALFATAIAAVSAILVLVQLEDPVEPSGVALTAAVGSIPEVQGWVSLAAGTALGHFRIWLGTTGRIRTRNAAFALGALYAWINPLQLFDTADGWIALSTAIAAGFVWGATRWQSSVLGGFAAVAVAVLIAQFVSILFDSPTTTTFVVAYGIPGVLALAGGWWMSRSPKTPIVSSTPAG